MDVHLSMLEALMSFEPAVFLFGGVAEDALLHGDWVRQHEDIDVLVERTDFPRQLENARELGFEIWETRFQPLADTPVVVGSIERGLNLEISICDRSPEGRVFFYMVDGHDEVVRVELTDDIFGYQPSMIDGVEVRTVSPLALFQIRAGIALAGGFGPLRPKDVPVQQALHDRFFPEVAIEGLAPTILRLPDR